MPNIPNELRVILTVIFLVIVAHLCHSCASDIAAVEDCPELRDDQELDKIITAVPLPATIDAEIEPASVRLNIDCYGLGSASGVDKVAVAYDDCDDKTAMLAASKIAVLASLLIDVWKDRDYPELGGLREHLNRFMVVSVHYDSPTDLVPEFARLKLPDLYAEDPDLALEKLGHGDAFCRPNGDPRFVDIGQEYSCFIVLGSTILTEGWADIVLHEIVHAALWVTYRDGDPDHNRHDIWLDHADITVMSEVLDRFYRRVSSDNK